MPLIQFPNVPKVPGVPQLLRQAGISIPGFSPQALLGAAATALGFQDVALNPIWGIFDSNGAPVIVPDSTITFEYMKDWRISDFPQERGSFESYNKVERPYDGRIALAKGGTDADREVFLNDLEDAAGSLELFNIVTPEVTYLDANITHYDYRRTSQNGVTLLIAEVHFEEVRQTAQQAFSNTKSPASNASQNGGTVQAQTPTTTQANAGARGPT